MHGLLHDFQVTPRLIETVDPSKADGRWKPGFQTRVAESRQAAIKMDDDDTAPLQIYTDGSGLNGQIGAAAVLFKRGLKVRSLRLFLGTETEHTVPEAEGVAMILGLELLKGERRVTRVSLAADNIGAILRAGEQRATPMQYIWDMFKKQWEATQKRFRNIRMTMRWVPGHEGVQGNEEADRLAKLAIEKGTSAKRKLPAGLRRTLPLGRQAVARRIHRTLKERTRQAWVESPRGAQMKKIDSSMPSGKFLKLTSSISRRQASLLIQLRTGHAPLQAYLHRIQRAESPMCTHCERGRETTLHYLMICPAFAEQRRRLVADAGQGARDMAKLLNDKKTMQHLWTYIAGTGRFG
jgi:ribonuclease HI